MNWDYWKGLLYSYWYYLLFSVAFFVVAVISLYYVQVQFNRRSQRLATYNLYQVTKQEDVVRDVAPLDPVVDGVLFPRPEVHRPLQSRLNIVMDWGPVVRNWTLREEPIDLKSAGSLRGPP